jgi:uncharacterized small protein (DUF1192 family)
MSMDDLVPRPKPPDFSTQDLSRLSIDELQRRIADLHAEIARTQAALDAKSTHKSAADALFGKKP